ncbi:hypothetical protein TOPH_09073 [Tolypocladium ophioglossoides CBS 100239]|uniref:Uncharacterized protein n=1 Tax=Tolypocladium ophioglossoides (strain CBS 100239) TaxID=1163406 RepID=A0A0L0MWZ7_TOLOC|nr:hypothetical protein TOPH_09073 [Tolypocladium ophioglossoides CBS 100239]
MRLVVLVPLLGLERVIYVTRDGRARQHDRPLLHRAELVEVSAEEDDEDPSKVSLRSAEPAELLADGVQRPRSEHAHLIDDEHVLFLPVHPGLAVDEAVRLR